MSTDAKSKEYTYFIQSVNGGPIKIGYTSKHPNSRLCDMKTGSPVQLHVVAYIESDVEKKLHGRFHKLRVHGEWFRPDRDLTDFIKRDPSVVRVNEVACDGLAVIDHTPIVSRDIDWLLGAATGTEWSRMISDLESVLPIIDIFHPEDLEDEDSEYNVACYIGSIISGQLGATAYSIDEKHRMVFAFIPNPQNDCAWQRVLSLCAHLWSEADCLESFDVSFFVQVADDQLCVLDGCAAWLKKQKLNRPLTADERNLEGILVPAEGGMFPRMWSNRADSEHEVLSDT